MTPSTSPYLHTAPPLRRVMRQVAAATLPGIAVLIYWQGSRWLGQLALTIAAAYALEAAVLWLRGKPYAPLRDGSVLVTAVLLALSLPVLAPWWIPLIGITFAVLLGKHLYGGLGQNPFNPAMVGFAVLLISFPAQMSDLETAKQKLEGAGISYENAKIDLVPETYVELETDDAEKVIRLIDSLENNDDVQAVYSNMEISEKAVDSLNNG